MAFTNRPHCIGTWFDRESVQHRRSYAISRRRANAFGHNNRSLVSRAHKSFGEPPAPQPSWKTSSHRETIIKTSGREFCSFHPPLAFSVRPVRRTANGTLLSARVNVPPRTGRWLRVGGQVPPGLARMVFRILAHYCRRLLALSIFFSRSRRGYLATHRTQSGKTSTLFHRG